MVKKIFFAIGGGEIGRTKILEDGSAKQYPVETMHIDRQIIKYSGKSNPNLLVVGTANKDDDGYYGVVEKHYSQRLNCNVSRLDITRNSYNKAQLEQIVFSANIIYISGGDTRYMLEEWKKSGLDQILIEAYNKGIIIAGCSAGAICWFDYYDNFDYRDEEGFKPELLEGLGLFKGVAVPHYDKVSKEDRKIIKDLFNGKEGVLFNINNKDAVLFGEEKKNDFRYIHSLDKLLKDYHSYNDEILKPMID